MKKINIDNIPEEMKDFYIWSKPKYNQYKLETIKKIKKEAHFSECVYNSDHESLRVSRNNDLKEFTNKLISEYCDLQLDTYNRGDITLNELKFRLSWVSEVKMKRE